MALQVTATRNSASLTDMFLGATYSIDATNGLTILSAMFADISCIYYSATEPAIGGYSAMQGAEIYVSTNFSATVNIPAITTAGTYYFMYINSLDRIDEVVEVVVTDDSGSGSEPGLQVNAVTTTEGAYQSYLAAAEYSADEANGLVITGATASSVYWSTDDKAIGTSLFSPTSATSASVSNDIFTIAEINAPGTYYLYTGIPGGYVGEKVTLTITETGGGGGDSGALSVTFTTSGGQTFNDAIGYPDSGSEPLTMTVDATNGLTINNVNIDSGYDDYLRFGTVAPTLNDVYELEGTLIPTATDVDENGFYELHVPTVKTEGTYYLVALGENPVSGVYNWVDAFATITITGGGGGSTTTLGIQVTRDPSSTTSSELRNVAWAIDAATGLTISDFYDDSTFHIFWSTTPLVTGAGISSLVSGGTLNDAGLFAATKVIAGIKATGTYYLTQGVANGTVQEIFVVTIDTTSPAAQLASPVGLAYSITSNSITFTYSSEHLVTNATGYKLRFATSIAGLESATEEVIDENTSVVKSDLSPDTTYYAQVKAISTDSSYGDSPWSAVYSPITDAPPAVNAPSVSWSRYSTSLIPTFSSVNNAASYLYRIGTSSPVTGDGTALVSGTAITGLSASTDYIVQVKSVGNGTTGSDSDWSEEVTVTTLEANVEPSAVKLAGADYVHVRLVTGQSTAYDCGALSATDANTWDTHTFTIASQKNSDEVTVSKFSISNGHLMAASDITAGCYLVSITATDSGGESITDELIVVIQAVLSAPQTMYASINGADVTLTIPLPQGLSPDATITVYRTETNPGTGTPVWTELGTIDVNGNPVVE